MNTKIAIGAALIGAIILGATFRGFGVAQQSSTPQETVETSFSGQQEDEIRSLVRDYLVNNPEVIIEAITVYQERERTATIARSQTGASNNLTALLEGNGGYTAGVDTGKAKVAIIEFFDYHCGYCKRANGLVQELASKDPDVKVVFRELPILSEESHIAAEYALAARTQNKYADFHFALMKAQGTLTESRIKDIAKRTGLDVKKLEAARRDPSVRAAIDETRAIAEEMGADGTPTFIVATLDGSFIEVMPGFQPESLADLIEEAKKAAG